MLRSGYSIDQFYRDFARDMVEIRTQLAEYRYILKLYSKRNEGKNPLEEFGSDAFGGGGFGSEDLF